MEQLINIPLYLYEGLYHVWWLIYALPWPTADDWFRWFLFLILGKLVWYVISRKMAPRNRVSENGAAAGVSSLFEHIH
jgi:hypothetical protein